MRPLIYLSVFALSMGVAAAQTTLQVVTKTVQRSVPWKSGYSVEIIGEKSEIEVEAVNAITNEVSVKAELTARHPRLDTAKIDLEAWRFVTSIVGKTIFIRAYIGVQSGRPLPSSNLKAKVIVLVPPNCAVTLSNKYGKAQLLQIRGAVKVSGEFCSFDLKEIRGTLQVNSQYGNVMAHNIEGKVNVHSKRADVYLSGIGADCTVQSDYGSVNVETSSSAVNITIDSDKGDVTVDAPEPYEQNFDLSAKHGSLELPLSLHLDPSAVVSNQSMQRKSGKHQPKIKVDTKFGKIVIR
jgi:Putative adhesin